jgi:hypothetical protein
VQKTEFLSGVVISSVAFDILRRGYKVKKKFTREKKENAKIFTQYLREEAEKINIYIRLYFLQPSPTRNKLEYLHEI